VLCCIGRFSGRNSSSRSEYRNTGTNRKFSRARRSRNFSEFPPLKFLYAIVFKAFATFVAANCMVCYPDKNCAKLPCPGKLLGIVVFRSLTGPGAVKTPYVRPRSSFVDGALGPGHDGRAMAGPRADHFYQSTLFEPGSLRVVVGWQLLLYG